MRRHVSEEVCVLDMLQMKRWRRAVALDPFILLMLSTLWSPQMMHDPCTSIFRPDFLTEKKRKAQAHIPTELPTVQT